MAKRKSVKVTGLCEDCEWWSEVIVANPKSLKDILETVQRKHDRSRMFCEGQTSIGGIISGTVEGLPKDHPRPADEIRRSNMFAQISRIDNER